MSDDRPLIEEFITHRIAPGARIVEVRQRAEGAQGYSGATLRYYDVSYEYHDVVEEAVVVTKPTLPIERRTLAWLDGCSLAVPRNHARAPASEGTAQVAMEYAGDAPPVGEGAASVAGALAAIHHAALGRSNELSWLAHADPAFFADAVVDRCWRGSWRHALTGVGYTDWYGRWRVPRPGGDPFWMQFASFDAPLEDAARHFVSDMAALWTEDETLTLIHADFHGDHVRARGNESAIIDWEQARYGPLYIDLPNYFTREESLLYRDALAKLGCDIPPERFLAGYDAASRYVGFKYFGIGVMHWREGDSPRRREDALYWISMALYGASGGRPIVAIVDDHTGATEARSPAS